MSSEERKLEATNGPYARASKKRSIRFTPYGSNEERKLEVTNGGNCEAVGLHHKYSFLFGIYSKNIDYILQFVYTKKVLLHITVIVQ